MILRLSSGDTTIEARTTGDGKVQVRYVEPECVRMKEYTTQEFCLADMMAGGWEIEEREIPPCRDV